MNPEFTTGRIRPIECVKEAYELIKDEYWLLFAVSLVGAIIGGVSMYIVLGPMICGIYLCYLIKIDGGRVDFNDLWKGFDYFGRSLLVTIVVVVPIVVYIVAIFATIYGPLIMKAVGGSRVSDEDMLTTLGVGLVVDIVVAVAMVCIHSLLMFAYPLIVDRGLPSVGAIKLSARATLRNAAGIGGMIAVNFLLALAGEAAFCVGIYLVIPLIMAANVVAYRRVFPATRPPILEPPMPSAYPELA